VCTRQARKDAKRLAGAGLRPKAEYLLSVLREDPFRSPPPFEKLLGDLRGAFSRRINVQHRLVYQVLPESRAVKVLRMWMQMATNLALDDALIEEARRIGKHRTKKEAVTSALREYVQRRRQLEILDLAGEVPFDESYDHKPLRHRKPRT
jgi:Txe/YoeB family toxin of toxin-antitoxin system